MKKIALVFISLLLLVSLVHAEYVVEEEVVTIKEELIPNYSELSFFYSSKRKDAGQGSQRFWHLKSTRLGWVSDYYCVDLALSPLTGSDPMVLKEAYVKLQPFGFMDMYLGKKAYDFNNVSSRSANNITIFQPQLFSASWQVLLSKPISNFAVDMYWADGGTPSDWKSYDRPSTAGAKVKYSNENMEAGLSLRVRDWDSDSYNDYGFYTNWNMFDMLDLNLQVYNIADDSNDTGDINYFGILSYSKGVYLPIFKTTTPYVGYFSKDDAAGEGGKEYNMVAGLHTSPVENGFIKMEYNYDSVDIDDPTTDNGEMSDAFTVSVGYEF